MGNVLWLKRRFDGQSYDVAYLNGLAHGTMPEPTKPNGWFYLMNRRLWRPWEVQELERQEITE